MDINMLMSELEAQTNVEANINTSMKKEIEAANELIKASKDKWLAFVKKAFPENIVNVMKRLGGTNALENSVERNAAILYPTVSLWDLHIAFHKDKLVFVQGNKVIGLILHLKETTSYNNYDYVSWCSYPVTLWKHIPDTISLETSKHGMARNREKIDLVYDFEKMFLDFQNALPKIYEEIARLNAEYIAAKRSTLAPVKTEEKPKSYSITVVIEEI